MRSVKIKLQSNFSETATQGTVFTGHCEKVTIAGRWLLVPEEVLAVHMIEGSDIFLGLKIYTRGIFFWIKRTVTYFLGLKNKLHIYLGLHISKQNFCCSQWIRKLFIKETIQCINL